MLYFWVDNGNFFKDSGFNLSKEYQFEMKKRDDGKHELSFSQGDVINILKNNNDDNKAKLENVTVLLGENGSGKTMLMKEITKFRCNATDTSLDKTKRLYVIKDRDLVFAETNLCEEDLICDSVKVYYYDAISKPNQSAEYGRGIYNITSVYITNAAYNMFPTVSSKHFGLEKMVFSPEGLSGVTYDFFDFIFMDSGIRTSSSHEMYSNCLKRIRGSMAFQQYCDMLYFNSLYSRKGCHNDGNNKTEKTEVRIPCFITLGAQKVSAAIENISEQETFMGKNIISDWTKLAKSIIDSKNIPDNDLIGILKQNLLFEWFLTKLMQGNDILNQNPQKGEWHSYYKNLKTYLLGVGRDSGDLLYYFRNAIKEIEELSSTIRTFSGEKYKNGDLYVIKFSGEEIKAIVTYVVKCIQYNGEDKSGCPYGSFVMRYLEIGNLAMSSGERAFLNIMSWLNYIADHDKITSNKSSYIKNNIFLCIDEIDALCHPEWQRDIVGNVIDALCDEYPGYNIQLVLSTHSPLCLSNIPRENILFLENHRDTGIREKKDAYISQTFGSNIYDILNESFFLKGNSIGQYAEKYIDNLIAEIKDIDSDDNLDDFLKKIELIGDLLIRSKLTEQLYRYAYRTKELEFRRKKELESRKKYIERELNKLSPKELQ